MVTALRRSIAGTWQDKLASWADRRLLRAALTLLLLADVAVGVNWLLSPTSSLSSPVYDVAKQIAPMDVWGALFLIAGGAAAGSLVGRGRRFISGYLVGGILAALWGFWAVLFTLAPLGRPGASFIGAILASCLCGLHCLTGLAFIHQPREPILPVAFHPDGA